MSRRNLALLLLVGGCSAAPAPKPAVPVTLPEGTKLSARLVTPISAGGSNVGDTLILVTDKPAGPIPVGSPITAKVTQSRSEGTLSGLLNQPARLAMEVNSIEVGGKSYKARFADGKEFSFNRDNTSEAFVDLKQALEDPEQRKVLEQLVATLADGKLPEVDDEKALRSLAQGLGLTQIEAAAQNASVGSLLKELQSPAGLARLAAGNQLEMALGAATEVFRLANSATRGLGRALRGRTIRAPVGMSFDLELAEPATLR